MRFSSDDAEIDYEVAGNGPPVVLLHPFPTNRDFWAEIAPHLSHRYRLIIPDLRAHGRSEVGKPPATMEKHVVDVLRLLEREQVGRAVFCGVSIGGYILMEFLRQARERVQALVLANTRASADTAEGRAARMKSVEQVRTHGPSGFLDEMLLKLMGKSTREARPDIAARARAMMALMKAEGIEAAQEGMAARPDSSATLKGLQIPTLLIGGEEDVLTPPSETEHMQRLLPQSRMVIIPKAGHYVAMEHPQEFTKLLRGFLDEVSGA